MESTLSAQQLQVLHKLIGQELYLEDVMRVFTFLLRDLRPPRVGAMQVCCSDEAEKECCDIFQRRFVEHFLPRLKFASAFPFRTVNLGGRYEWNSVGIAESHFAGSDPGDPCTLMLIKLDSHVSVAQDSDGSVYGKRPRYQPHEESFFCGFLHDLLDGGQSPSSQELRQLFGSEGRDRIQTLLDPERVDPSLRSVFVAIVNARLQARKCILDLQDQPRPAPVFHIVLPCVTFNRTGRDTEMVCGVYGVDRRVHPAAVTYCGLNSEAETYRVESQGDRLIIRSADSLAPRQARDHRQLLKRTHQDWLEDLKTDDRLDEIRYQTWLSGSQLQPYTGVLLKSLLAVLLELSPVPAVLLLFGEGLIDIHHIFRLQQLSGLDDPEQEARTILGDFQGKVDGLPPERIRHAVELLLEAYDLKLDRMNKPPAPGVSSASDTAPGATRDTGSSRASGDRPDKQA